ncbi:hypothetical protein ADN00_15520 [Ornatilinea apprima]|uniref:HTH cro/C1-type domain-containing protein n=1 Tax=Ornatilinea apprima TaxID=1134406 RepID=A0A0P6WZI2_9CHLR|nr:hypothetical protein [Ornatilinea apprima]KPL72227.1 hypothetical protein ADN00_15520 [Ornatilinea apprima]
MLRLQIKGSEILKMSGEANNHRLALKARVSYPTVDRWINRSQNVQSIDLAALANLLLDGIGLSPDELLARPLGDFFELVEVDQN